jgi:hypothetical protein
MRRAVVTGMIASYPLGGVAWDYAHYALGLEEMGFEVMYLEDTGCQTFHPETNEDDVDFSVGFLHSSLAALSPTLGRRWHFRALDGRMFGLDFREASAFVRNANLMLNVSGSTLLRNEYMDCPRKVLIETDPGWNHFVTYPALDASQLWPNTHSFREHDYFFTYAANAGRPGCPLPSLGLAWYPTRPLVALDRWHSQPPGEHWTTVMSWDTYCKPIVHAGVTYGAKEMEFARVESLPELLDVPLEIAVGGAFEQTMDHWRQLGWSVRRAQDVSRTAGEYRDYIQGSRGEFSIAKNVYAATRSGWFSCRSICYLAAGLPVVTQDTGCSDLIPNGEGLLLFNSLEAAAAALRTVESDYPAHQRAARRLAELHFSPPVVLGEIFGKIGLS